MQNHLEYYEPVLTMDRQVMEEEHTEEAPKASEPAAAEEQKP